MTTRIYTRTGDAGDTGLFGGRRVPKDDLRVVAYGDVDELNAALGWAGACGPSPELGALIARLQSLLFELGAELATPPEKERPSSGVIEEDVSWLEAEIDRAEVGLLPLRQFVLPGGAPAGAALHLCRVVCRRAERRVVTLRRAEPETSALTVKVLNRLADLLFVLARRANHEAGVPDVPWKARTS